MISKNKRKSTTPFHPIIYFTSIYILGFTNCLLFSSCNKMHDGIQANGHPQKGNTVPDFTAVFPSIYLASPWWENKASLTSILSKQTLMN